LVVPLHIWNCPRIRTDTTKNSNLIPADEIEIYRTYRNFLLYIPCSNYINTETSLWYVYLLFMNISAVHLYPYKEIQCPNRSAQDLQFLLRTWTEPGKYRLCHTKQLLRKLSPCHCPSIWTASVARTVPMLRRIWGVIPPTEWAMRIVCRTLIFPVPCGENCKRHSNVGKHGKEFPLLYSSSCIYFLNKYF
jgi:hypothetical protein